jgi:hypothetical protein
LILNNNSAIFLYCEIAILFISYNSMFDLSCVFEMSFGL